MNEFLNKLDEKISILEKTERNKILKKYQKEIENNIKDGLSENEAIEKIGTLEDITKKVYDDYHIDTNYENNKSLGKRFNDFISLCAEFLTEFCCDLVKYIKNNTKDKPLEAFFEILLKILLLIMAFMVIKIPFIILEEFFNWSFGLLFYPFNSVLSGIAEFILAIIYFICCVLMAIATFKNYYDKPSSKKEETEKTKVENISSETSEVKISKNYALMILKVFIYIILIIPLIFLNIIFAILAILSLFLVFKGINIIGLSILLFGLFLLLVTVTNYITDALDNRESKHRLSLLVSIMVLVLGIIFFISNLFSFNYPKSIEDSLFVATNDTTMIDIDNATNITTISGDVVYEIDSNLKDNQLLLEVSYYDEFIDIKIEHYKGKDSNYILLYPFDDNTDFKMIKYFYEITLEDLKNNNIFNYNELRQFKVKIFCNEKTKELLK